MFGRPRKSRKRARAQLAALTLPEGGNKPDELQQAIRKHPWGALAVGAGVGFLLGLSPKLRNGVILSMLHLAR